MASSSEADSSTCRQLESEWETQEVRTWVERWLQGSEPVIFEHVKQCLDPRVNNGAEPVM